MIGSDRRTAMAWLCGGAFLLTAAKAKKPSAPAVPTLDDKGIARLKPGQFLWKADAAREGPLFILVRLSEQRAYVYRDGLLIGASTISAGREGYETPVGIYTLLQKARMHNSNLYSNAPMPFMQRLTWDGIAIHSGHVPGYPASHGCIRLPPAFARTLYGMTPIGMTVAIVGDVAPVPEVVPDGGRWEPHRVAEGPIAIIVGARDGKLSVLRGGIEIGRTMVEIPAPITATSAFLLRTIDGGAQIWSPIPLPGSNDAPADRMFPGDGDRLRIPDAFRTRLGPLLAPGALFVMSETALKSTVILPEATVPILAPDTPAADSPQ
ncbi:L,D-transpeptidase [Sphingomonas sp. DBB INV C78]|uniref:L,D-transpeptidase family protein n=1 Tax=Sphingomonas sp. DBB INV C78 TaxID=3349434 RepID=UPI0036D38BA7